MLFWLPTREPAGAAAPKAAQTWGGVAEPAQPSPRRQQTRKPLWYTRRRGKPLCRELGTSKTCEERCPVRLARGLLRVRTLRLAPWSLVGLDSAAGPRSPAGSDRVPARPSPAGLDSVAGPAIPAGLFRGQSLDTVRRVLATPREVGGITPSADGDV